MTLPIPTPAEPMVDGSGRPTIHWRRYLAQIEAQGNAQLASDVEAIARALGSPDGKVANIPPQAELVATLTGRNGIRLFGTLASGNVRFELDQLANTGVGAALVKITVDAYGRVEGRQSAFTDDLPESASPTNLYHTAQRVRDTLLTGLSTATNAVITATDSVLTGLGKLQAQVSGILANYVTTARTISTTAPLTGGGDLSANRTLAISAATSGAAGSMSAADKAKLDGVAAGATANSTDAQLRDRGTHTGTQLASTISDFGSAAGVSARRSISASEDLVLTDVGKTIYAEGPAGQTLTIPPDGTVDWPEGASIRFVNYSGAFTIARGAGVAMYWLGAGAAGSGSDANRIVGDYSWARIWQHSTNFWFIEGNNLS